MDPEPSTPSPGPPLAQPPAGSVVLRAVLIVVGTISLGIGLIGLVVPVLPTTPFILLAAACYARASTRLYGWLLGQKTVGSIVLAWRRSHGLPPGMRVRAIATVILVFAVSVALVDDAPIRIGLVATGLVLVLFLARLPEVDPEA